MTEHHVNGIAFASVYVDDFQVGYAFYSEVLGLEKLYDMGSGACFFSLPDDTGLYLQGGSKSAVYDADTLRPAFVLAVASASGTYGRLQSAGVRFVHPAPVDMGGDNHWFQFYDPAGNLLEVLGPA